MPPHASLPYISTPSYQSQTMSPSPTVSPLPKMSQAQRTSSQDSTADGIRKRVCKACDRCRLKKSKCDGAHPCSRCKADNAICVFGERKKSHDKVYPKGYVEMLEQQQNQLVTGLQEMYKRLQDAQAWSGPQLTEANGHPLTHDILAALNLLEKKLDGSGEMETFEEDCQKLQSKLISEGAGFVQRRSSFSSDSDHSQNGQPRSVPQVTPTLSRPTPSFRDSFVTAASASPSPLTQSPVPRSRQSYPPAQSSPLHSAPLANDPQLYQAEWAIPDMSNPAQIMRSRFAMQEPEMDMNLNAMENFMGRAQWEPSPNNFDAFTSDQESFNQLTNTLGGMHGLQDFAMPTDPMDVDFSKFIQVST